MCSMSEIPHERLVKDPGELLVGGLGLGVAAREARNGLATGGPVFASAAVNSALIQNVHEVVATSAATSEATALLPILASE